MGQTARNAMQRGLTPQLGALGATLVRFLFGFPFALLFLAAVLGWQHAALPAMNRDFLLWTVLGAPTQIGGTALMLMTMEQRSFVVTIAYLKTEPVLVALMGLLFLRDPLSRAMALAIVTAMAGVALISVKPEALTGGIQAGACWASPPPPCSRLPPSAIAAPSCRCTRPALCWAPPFRWRLA